MDISCTYLEAKTNEKDDGQVEIEFGDLRELRLLIILYKALNGLGLSGSGKLFGYQLLQECLIGCCLDLNHHLQNQLSLSKSTQLLIDMNVQTHNIM